MEADKIEMYKSLVEWFAVVTENDSQLGKGPDLSDGVSMARALHKFAPDFFTETWLQKIKIDVGTNWRLKVSNLKKVVESIIDYYVEVLNITLNDFTRPDVMKIAEKYDQAELGHLLQMILGCAINCPLKMDYIRQIMELEESLQRNIMQAIQELETVFQGSLASRPGGLGANSMSSFDLKTIHEDRDRLAQKCHEADRQIVILLEEKSSMQQEIFRLQSELEHFENPLGTSKNKGLIGDDGTSLGPVEPGSTRYNDLRRQLDALKEELLQAETSRDDLKFKAIQLEKENFALKSKVDENSHLVTELAQLKDELDALREANDKLKVSEALILTYKKKLEDHHDLKRQVKLLEDRNAEYLQQNFHQEENVKKLSTLKGQVELYKKEIQELHSRLDIEMNKSVKVEFDLSNANAKITSLQREKDILTSERDGLLDTCDQLRCSQGLAVGDTDNAGNTISNELMSPAFKEKLNLLEAENKALREGQGGQTALSQLLDDANQRSEKLREQLKTANQKILSLTQNSADETAKSGDEAQNRQKESLDGNEPKTLNHEIARLQSKCVQLESALSARDQELALAEQRYRKYAEKAKEVIKNLDPRVLSDSVPNLDKNTENDQDPLLATPRPSMGPLEERLMTTAFYNLSISCQRDAVDSRLALINGGGQSFLNRQRLPPPRKPSVNLRHN